MTFFWCKIIQKGVSWSAEFQDWGLAGRLKSGEKNRGLDFSTFTNSDFSTQPPFQPWKTKYHREGLREPDTAVKSDLKSEPDWWSYRGLKNKTNYFYYLGLFYSNGVKCMIYSLFYSI